MSRVANGGAVVQSQRRQEWASALVSGEFKQGRKYLRDRQSRWCPLGVAAELYRRATGKGRWKRVLNHPHAVHEFSLGKKDDALICALPDAVLQWYGISKSAAWDIAHACDEGLTFRELAIMVQHIREVT